MSVFTLKIIAIISMLIDHIGLILLPSGNLQYLFRSIGRIAFPIFCFLLTEGYSHTSNLKKYILRLSAFAIISEIPFDLAINGSLFDFSHQNVFFTLLLGLILIAAVDCIKKKTESFILESPEIKIPAKAVQILLSVSLAAAISAVSIIIQSDYSIIGILAILSFHLFRRKRPVVLVLMSAVNILLGGLRQLPAAYSACPLMLYNGKKGPSIRWLFYIFYPAHLLALYLIGLMI